MTAPASGTTLSAEAVDQVFVFTSSATIDYTNPSGASQVADSLDIDLKKDALLIISYSVRASLTPRTSTQVPMVFVRCEVDSAPCSPNGNDVVWLIPEFCCDSRTFTWIFPKAGKGKHTVKTLWGMGNPTAAHFTLRSLVVEAARI
jgi:hypothetical protein